MSAASLLNPLRIERHGDIDVVREDLCCDALPSGKLRGLLPWVDSLKGVSVLINHAVSTSNSHAITAFVAKAGGLRAVSYANCVHPTPQTLMAESLGAKVIYAGGKRRRPLRAQALKHREEGALQVPWGFAVPEAIRHIAAAVSGVPGRYDAHVVPIGAGGYICGVEYGLRLAGLRPAVYGVPYTGTVERNLERVREISPACRIAVHPRPEIVEETPFPSDPNYEWLAWPLAQSLAAEGKRVLFWSVGRPLCE